MTSSVLKRAQMQRAAKYLLKYIYRCKYKCLLFSNTHHIPSPVNLPTCLSRYLPTYRKIFIQSTKLHLVSNPATCSLTNTNLPTASWLSNVAINAIYRYRHSSEYPVPTFRRGAITHIHAIIAGRGWRCDIHAAGQFLSSGVLCCDGDSIAVLKGRGTLNLEMKWKK